MTQASIQAVAREAGVSVSTVSRAFAKPDLVLPETRERVMAAAEKLTTTVSSKGQVILPSALRQRRAWAAGTRLTVEETEDGVLLKPAPAFAETRPEDVFRS